MTKKKTFVEKNKKSHVKLGDKIKVISGNQKGLIGNISSILKTKSLATVKEILPRIKYKKTKGEETKAIEVPIYIHLSNLMLWESSTNSASRIGYKIIDNKKKRYFKKTGNLVQ